MKIFSMFKLRVLKISTGQNENIKADRDAFEKGDKKNCCSPFPSSWPKALTGFILISSVLIYWSTLDWPYTMDSIDRLINIAGFQNFHEQAAYFFRREDCHFMPLYLSLHFVFYKLFWLRPEPFHILIILTFALTGLVLMRLVFELTDCRKSALFSGVLFCWQTSYLKMMDIVSWPYLLTLLEISGALLGVYLYAKTKRWRWAFLAIVMAFLAPCSYAIGVPIGLWILLFYFFCVPAKFKSGPENTRKMAVPVVISWLGGVIIYWNTVHPGDVFLGRVADQQLMNFSYATQALWLMRESFWNYAIPSVTSWRGASLFLACFLIIMAAIKRRDVSWGAVIFFLFWSAGNYFLIYYVRGNWGERLLNAQWYHFYPFVGLVVIYSLITAAIFKDQELGRIQFKKIAGISLVALIILYGVHQQRVVSNYNPTRTDLYKIAVEFRDLLENYWQETGRQELILIDRPVSLGGGLYPWPKPLRFYAALFSPKTLYDKIEWGSETDGEFVNFIQRQGGRYPHAMTVLVQ